MRIVAYIWEADIHCVDCTAERFPVRPGPVDQNGVPVDATDREGNLVTPVFNTSEIDWTFKICGSCGKEL